MIAGVLEFPAPPRDENDSSSVAPIADPDLPPWSAVELELGVTEDLVTFVGRDLDTGRPRLKVQLSRADASADWPLWIRSWLEAHRARRLTLLRGSR